MQVTPENIGAVAQRLKEIQELLENKSKLETILDNPIYECKNFMEITGINDSLSKPFKVGSIAFSTDSVGCKTIVESCIKDVDRRLKRLGFRQPKVSKS